MEAPEQKDQGRGGGPPSVRTLIYIAAVGIGFVLAFAVNEIGILKFKSSI